MNQHLMAVKHAQRENLNAIRNWTPGTPIDTRPAAALAAAVAESNELAFMIREQQRNPHPMFYSATYHKESEHA